MNTYWGTDVTKLARVILLDRQFNKDHKLPSPRDITKLNEYMNNAVKKLDLETKSKENYKGVADLVAAKVTLYNRRRPGEVENLK